MPSIERETRLKEELAKVKLEIRDDSQLCKEYIEGSDLSLEDVVKEMATMHYLHSYTEYKADLERVADYLIKSRGPFRGVWRCAAQSVKLVHVSKGLPEKWPWL
jgi:hypothetical protein